jgi:HSP20 family protein
MRDQEQKVSRVVLTLTTEEPILRGTTTDMPNYTWRRPGTMPMDAYRSENNLVINLDLPGVDSDSLDVTIEKHELKISATRTRPEVEGIEWLASERPYGTFTCSLSLGESVDVDALHAGYEHGVLTITVPVIEPAARRIEVTRGGESPERIEAPVAA